MALLDADFLFIYCFYEVMGGIILIVYSNINLIRNGVELF